MPTFKQLMKLAQVTVNDKTSGKRAKEILEIVHKDQVLHGMDPQKAVRFLEDLGPTYVKIGQLASEPCRHLAQGLLRGLRRVA